MTDVQINHHGLEGFLRARQGDRIANAGIEVEIIPDCSHFNLRGKAHDSGFSTSIVEVLQQNLPTINAVNSSALHRIYGLGPDEWLIVTAKGMPAALGAHLDTMSRNHAAALNDLSGGQILLRLTGKKVQRLLAMACPLDLHENVFPPGACAQTGFAKASMLIARIDSESFEIIVRRSFSDYVLKWLAHSGKSIGIEFSVR
jgi:sarcosine oxidase subunit gamma